MKRTAYLLITSLILASCGGGSKNKSGNNAEELAKLKKERSSLDLKIQAMEAAGSDSSKKAVPVSVQEMTPATFNSYIEVQAQVNGDQNVNAIPQSPGIVKKVFVRVGQHVSTGQILATLDAAMVEQQIKGADATLILQKALYEKQQTLWKQNIGTEVQLMTAKANYEAAAKQKAALIAQKDMYTIKSPISGTVDAVNLKVGEPAGPGVQSGIHVVSFEKLKVQATLGENYLGDVKQNDPVNLIFSDIGDTMHTTLSYVGQSVDPISRAFQVEVRLNSNKKLHPNMSCKMQIANYHKSKALVVPVSVIQHTAQGDMLYVVTADNKAKAVTVKVGQNSNGKVEILSGLNPGDKVIVEGFEDMYEGQKVSIQ